jgi:hypothetical protein
MLRHVLYSSIPLDVDCAYRSTNLLDDICKYGEPPCCLLVTPIINEARYRCDATQRELPWAGDAMCRCSCVFPVKTHTCVLYLGPETKTKKEMQLPHCKNTQQLSGGFCCYYCRS